MHGASPLDSPADQRSDARCITPSTHCRHLSDAPCITMGFSSRFDTDAPRIATPDITRSYSNVICRIHRPSPTATATVT